MNEVLKQLGLTSLAATLPMLLDDARQQQISYELFLQRALGAELVGRQERALQRRLRAARLPSHTHLATFDYSFQPSLSQRLMKELAGLSFVQTATNVIFLGPPGVGKTHLASGLAARAIEGGYSALFTTLSQLTEDLAAAPHPSLWRQRLRRYVVPRVLVIDEVGYTRLTVEQAHQLFELVVARYERGPILLTSNTSFAEWGTLLGDEVLAGALLDRLLHHAEVVTINGRSYRMRHRAASDLPRKEAGSGADGTN